MTISIWLNFEVRGVCGSLGLWLNGLDHILSKTFLQFLIHIFFVLSGGLRVNNGKAYNFEVKCMQKEIGIYRMPLFVSFIYEADQSTKQIAREILLKVTNADVEFIKPTTVGLWFLWNMY